MNFVISYSNEVRSIECIAFLSNRELSISGDDYVQRHKSVSSGSWTGCTFKFTHETLSSA